MKKIIFFLLVLSTYLLAPIHAQRPRQEGPRHEKRPDITEMVGDLSAAQKGKLETITNESKKRIETLPLHGYGWRSVQISLSAIRP